MHKIKRKTANLPVTSPVSDGRSSRGELPDAKNDEAFPPISAQKLVRIDIIFFDVNVETSFSQQSKYDGHTDEGDSNHLIEAGPDSNPHYHQNLRGGPPRHEDRQVDDYFEPSEPEGHVKSLKRSADVMPVPSSSVYSSFGQFDDDPFNLFKNTSTASAPFPDNIVDMSPIAGGMLSDGLEDDCNLGASIAANTLRRQYPDPRAP